MWCVGLKLFLLAHPPKWIMLDPSPPFPIKLCRNTPPPIKLAITPPPPIELNFCSPFQIDFWLCTPPNWIIIFQKDIKIAWVRNHYLLPQMLHNVNDEFVFRVKIYVSNTQLYFTVNIMVCIVETTAFPTNICR